MTDERVVAEVEAVKEYFKNTGMRWTRQRMLIVEEAFLTHKHFTVEDLCDMLRRRNPKESVHLATVYRTLQVLEQGGFIEGMELGRGGRLYEHTLGHEHHDHVICLDCGRIVEFTDLELEDRKRDAAKRLGFTMESHALQIFARCDQLARGSCVYYDADKAADASKA